MPTLIIEDGSNVANANCYVDLAYVRAYADNRGAVVSNRDATLGQQIIASTDYLESRRFEYGGYKTNTTQSLQFPRTDLVMDKVVTVGKNSIPEVLKQAQAQLCIEQHAGTVLFPLPDASVGGQVTQETVGPITVKYSEEKSAGSKYRGVTFAAVETMLASLFNDGANGYFLNTIRV
tara:strand:- start:136 stop:666 length:531 start_codon:yes stop_codon:yes gene_type:complete